MKTRVARIAWPICFCFFCFACGEETKQGIVGGQMLNQEISSRLSALMTEIASLKEKGIDPALIHKRFGDFLLLSKDHENPKACIYEHNRYLFDLTNKFALNASQWDTLTTAMDLAHIEQCLKQNELNILNQLWMSLPGHSVDLQSVK